MKKPSEEFDSNTHAIISAAYEVHNSLGPGFQEVVYQRALFYEMHLRGMEFSREEEINISYKGRNVGTRRIDFFVGECLVEIKAKAETNDIDFAQTLSYLQASGKQIGLLLNFGAQKLEIKRIINTKHKS